VAYVGNEEPKTLELPRGITGRVLSSNYGRHLHASDSQDRGKPEQTKVKAMFFKHVKRIKFLFFLFFIERPSADGGPCVTFALGNQPQGATYVTPNQPPAHKCLGCHTFQFQALDYGVKGPCGNW
jgi:hypothetical protein